jgi:AraC-like DNA-binding protein
MFYQKFAPPEKLQSVVKYFWILQNSPDEASSTTFTAIPDGCPGIIFHQPDTFAFYDQWKEKLPPVFLYGQTIEPPKFYAIGNFHFIGICFYPNALKSVFGFDAYELTNGCLDLNLLPLKKCGSLSEQLVNTASTAEQIKILSSYMLAQIEKNDVQAEGITRYALSQIVQSKGSLSFKTLHEKLQLTERTLERKFKQTIGIAPKLFSRICRFQESLNQLRKSNYSKLSDIAYENEYADQSHFIRTFKEFTGYSPYQYQKQLVEVVENFPQILE